MLDLSVVAALCLVVVGGAVFGLMLYFAKLWRDFADALGEPYDFDI